MEDLYSNGWLTVQAVGTTNRNTRSWAAATVYIIIEQHGARSSRLLGMFATKFFSVCHPET